MARRDAAALAMPQSTIETDEQYGDYIPKWAELQAPFVSAEFATDEQYGDYVPKWAELQAPFVSTSIDTDEQYGDYVPKWAELQAPIISSVMETEPDPSQPFIDGLAPVTVGSEWRDATLRAAKLADASALTVLSPTPGSDITPLDVITIPCGDRIPEDGVVQLNELGYVDSGPSGLDNSKTVIVLNDAVIYRNEVAYGGFTVTPTPNSINGFDYAIEGFIPLGPVTIDIYIEGAEGFSASLDYTSVDLDAPVVSGLSPAPLETGVLVTKDIQLTVDDPLTGIDLTQGFISISTNAGGPWTEMWNPSGFQPGYDGVGSTRTGDLNTQVFNIDPDVDLVYFSYYHIKYEFYDNAGNVVADQYYFQIQPDDVFPIINVAYPTGGATAIAPSTNIAFNVTENYSMDIASDDPLSTIEVQINGGGWVEIFSEGTFIAGWNGPNSGYTVLDGTGSVDVVVDKEVDFDLGDVVDVRLTMRDYFENTTIETYTFYVDGGPVVTPVSPVAGATEIDINDPIILDITDEGPIDTANVLVEVRLDGVSFEAAYDGSAGGFQAGWTLASDISVIAGGYRITLQYDTELPLAATIAVRITAVDENGYPARFV